MDFRKKSIKSYPSNMVLCIYAVFISNGPIQQNEKSSQQTFIKGQVRSGPSKMILPCSIY